MRIWKPTYAPTGIGNRHEATTHAHSKTRSKRLFGAGRRRGHAQVYELLSDVPRPLRRDWSGLPTPERGRPNHRGRPEQPTFCTDQATTTRNTMKHMYAFRAWSPPHDPRNQADMDTDTSSAEWPEDLALELGDRVSEHYFFESMWQAYMTEPYPFGARLERDIID